MPTENDILDRLRPLIAEHYEIDESMIERDCNFYVDFGSDTYAFLELVVKVEDEFELTIPEIDAKKFETVSALVKYIVQRRR